MLDPSTCDAPLASDIRHLIAERLAGGCYAGLEDVLRTAHRAADPPGPRHAAHRAGALGGTGRRGVHDGGAAPVV